MNNPDEKEADIESALIKKGPIKTENSVILGSSGSNGSNESTTKKPRALSQTDKSQKNNIIKASLSVIPSVVEASSILTLSEKESDYSPRIDASKVNSPLPKIADPGYLGLKREMVKSKKDTEKPPKKLTWAKTATLTQKLQGDQFSDAIESIDSNSMDDDDIEFMPRATDANVPETHRMS